MPNVLFTERFCGQTNTHTDIKEANFFGSKNQYVGRWCRSLLIELTGSSRPFSCRIRLWIVASVGAPLRCFSSCLERRPVDSEHRTTASDTVHDGHVRYRRSDSDLGALGRRQRGGMIYRCLFRAQ